MKRFLSVVIIVTLVGAIGFLTMGWYLTKDLLNEYNGMASENFATALALFRDGYQAKRIPIFGESEEYSSFEIDGYEFVVIPASKTTSNRTSGFFNAGLGNMGSHANGMAVMLACKWIDDGDARGEELLGKLKAIFPNFWLSAPNLVTVTIKDLEVGSEMMKSEASQWIWRMGDSHDTKKAQQGIAPHASRRGESDD